jgi:thiosulfate/3-mercaptopyruvate sulfurtransferase
MTTTTQRLVDPQWLADHLDTVRVVEIDVSAAAYTDGHITGAALWNVYTDFRRPDYRLADSAAIQTLVERTGITPDTTVVFYGYAPALAVWLLTAHGHRDARILDCSRTTWHDRGLPWSTDRPDRPPSTYLLRRPDPALRAALDDVRAAIDDRSTTILDVRSTEEYQGERFWPSGGMQDGGRAGHIPSAVHTPLGDLYNADGSLRDPDELRARFDALPPGDLITYCTIGGRAATAWFVLTHMLGRPGVRVYDGSWAEWGLTPEMLVA